MNLSKNTIFLAIILLSIAGSGIMQAMQQKDLMLRFTPSHEAQLIMKSTKTTRGIEFELSRQVLPTDLARKAALYNDALFFKNYPLTMPDELKKSIVFYPVVMEAVLATAEKYTTDSFNDYIRAFWSTAARIGNIGALKFFINKGININNMLWDFTALDRAVENDQEIAKNLLLQHGAKSAKDL